MVWLKCWASTHPEYPASIIDWKQMQKIKKPPFTVNYLWGEPSLIDLFILMMPPLPQIWLSAFPACSWGPFSSEGGPAELRSCNFRACKYFTGNDCGKPRKWHRLSSTLYIFSKNHTLLSAPTVGCVASPMTFLPFVRSGRWAADSWLPPLQISIAAVQHLFAVSQPRLDSVSSGSVETTAPGDWTKCSFSSPSLQHLA